MTVVKNEVRAVAVVNGSVVALLVEKWGMWVYSLQARPPEQVAVGQSIES